MKGTLEGTRPPYYSFSVAGRGMTGEEEGKRRMENARDHGPPRPVAVVEDLFFSLKQTLSCTLTSFLFVFYFGHKSLQYLPAQVVLRIRSSQKETVGERFKSGGGAGFYREWHSGAARRASYFQYIA
uniref:Uncharacterized protein n=1 Tax=Ascaris lumbricoides TaxID=6252 RepID=A0A9J2P5U2_ASCLU